MKKRIFTQIISATSPANIDGLLSEELKVLQDDANTIEDVTIMPDLHHHNTYLALITYSFVS